MNLKQVLFQNLDRKLKIGYFAFLFCWMVIAYSLLIGHGFFSWDYFKYYQCGAMALSADRLHAYDPAVQMRWYNQIISPLRVDVMAYNQSVPSWFILMIPLALIPAAPGFYVWTIGTLAFGLSGLYLMMRELQVGSLNKRLLALSIACLASYPAFHWFQLGQSSWFLIGFYTYLFYGLLARRNILSGSMFALAAIKPQYLPFVFALMLAEKRYASLAFAALSGALLLLLCSLVIGFENVVFYPKIVLNAETSIKVFGVFQESMICFRGLLSRVLPHGSLMGTLLALALLACAVVWMPIYKLLSASKSAAEKPQTWGWLIAVTILMILIFSPHVHIYDAQLMIIAAAASLGQNVKSRMYTAWTVLLYLYPVFCWVAFLALYIPGADIQNYPFLFLPYHLILLCLALGLTRMQLLGEPEG